MVNTSQAQLLTDQRRWAIRPCARKRSFCYGLTHLTERYGPRARGSVVPFHRRAPTDGGGWQITHEHESTPFYWDGSDRAATDLAACRAGDCRDVGGVLHRHSVRVGPSPPKPRVNRSCEAVNG